MRAIRRLETMADVLLVGIVRREERREDRDQQPQGEDHEPGHRQRVPPEREERVDER